MKSIITGASGFIGSKLKLKIENTLDCDIHSATFTPEQLIEVIDDLEFKCVFHLGAISSTTEADVTKLCKNNLMFSALILEKCIERNIPFVYASSASVYGTGLNGFSENALLTPINYYAISKASFDMFAKQKIIDNPSSKIIGLRYFNVYGDSEDHKGDMSSPVHKFLSQTKKGSIRVFKGSDNFKRDFIHVDDVINITEQAVNFPSGIYNVGTGNARSFMEVAKVISNLTNTPIQEVDFPKKLIGKYQSYTCSNNCKIKKVTDYKIIYNLEEGIKDVASRKGYIY